MTNPLRTTPVLLSLALVALLGQGEAPRFVPKEGVTVRRTLEMKGTRELTSLVLQIGDETQPADGAKRHVELSWRQVTKDEIGTCSADRVDVLTRTYEKLERHRLERAPGRDGQEQVVEIDETCDLEGRSVRFTWNADEDLYTRKFAGPEEGQAELLADLEADMDYREFLPEKGAEAGAKWERDFADVKVYFLRPGGDLPFHGETPTRALDRRMREAVWDATGGRVEFQLGTPREEEGRHLVAITFRGKNTAEAGLDADGDEPGPTRLELSADETFEGQLTWDLDAHRARSIEWNAKGRLVLEVSLPIQRKDSDEKGTLVQAYSFDTDYDYTGTFTRE